MAKARTMEPPTSGNTFACIEIFPRRGYRMAVDFAEGYLAHPACAWGMACYTTPNSRHALYRYDITWLLYID